MKKGLIALLAAFLLTGCGRTQSATITNPITLNTTTADMSGYTQLTDNDLAFTAITIKESLRMFDEKGSGIIYYGMPYCDYCQAAVPELNTAAKTMGVTVYYVDVTNATADDSYEDLKKALESTFKTNTSGQKDFMIPEVIAVKNGVIVDSHLSITSDYKTDYSKAVSLSETQKLELQNIYKELMREAAD